VDEGDQAAVELLEGHEQYAEAVETAMADVDHPEPAAFFVGCSAAGGQLLGVDRRRGGWKPCLSMMCKVSALRCRQRFDSLGHRTAADAAHSEARTGRAPVCGRALR